VQQTAHPRVALSYYCLRRVCKCWIRAKGTGAFAVYFWVLAKGRSEAIKLGEEVRKEVLDIIE
jgi:hypothetical protein